LKQPTKISEYVNTVCEQIRWKKAHCDISEEIENHITDQKNAYLAEGLDEETATAKAINDMGDPVLVGTEFNRTHRPKTEWSIIALTAFVLLLGLAVRTFFMNDYGASASLTSSIIGTLFGIGFMIIAYFMDFTLIGRFSKAINIGLFLLIIAVMFASPTINGQYAYVPFLLLLLPTAFAGIVYSMRSKAYLGIILCGLFFAAAIVIGMMTPSVASAGLFSLNALILLTLAIAKGWFKVNKLVAMLLVYIPIAITGIVFILTAMAGSSYRWLRLHHAIDPSLDPMGAGYIGTVTRDLIKGAAFIGRGESSLHSGNVLPGIHTDSLLTYLISQYGWISFLVIMSVMLLLIIRFFVLCSKQKSVLGRLVSTSILITFTAQVVLFVAFNLGFQLFSPLTLPLISYGGKATIINMILIGIMLSVFRSGDFVLDRMPKSAKSNRIKIGDGKLTIYWKTKP